MKRLIIIILCCLPFLASADDFAQICPDVLHGPVKMVKSATFVGVQTGSFRNLTYDSSTPIDIAYYDTDSRETKLECWYKEELKWYYITTYAGDSSSRINYDSEGNYKNYKIVKFYNQAGLPVRIDTYTKSDTIWVSDSLVYNQWNKIAIVYHSHHLNPFQLWHAFKFDEQGRIIGGRTFDDGKEVSGFKVDYSEEKILVSYASNRQDEGVKTWAQEYIFDKKGRLIEERTNNWRKVYSAFDKYDNWTRCITTATTGPMINSSATIVREITYWPLKNI